ncbi:olfactory receptor 6B1-like [Pseudophryne corroboree]|uniref:olfactory receptor 6B1-like n=1 Tax=Pseudophryne corroboree TaxID=495146 RepID=UPI0030816331
MELKSEVRRGAAKDNMEYPIALSFMISGCNKNIFVSTLVESNKTVVKNFILLAFADVYKFQNLLFFFFLLTYITCVMGNVAIIVLIRVEPSLHTVMYYFISVFSVLEIMLVSITVPKLLANLISGNNIISFNECFVQLYIFISLGATECYVLMVMVFDRYLAINNPLHYQAIMTPMFCTELAILPWTIGFGIILLPVIATACLDFCGPNGIDHFFCDLAPLQNLACSDPFISNLSTIIATILVVVFPFFTILGFYIRIIMTVSKIKSEEGKQKAFSTCSSHLIVGGLFYGTAIIVYVKPKGSHYDKYLCFMYTALTPMINPFIYTFRNRDVKKAFKIAINNLMKSVAL